MDLPGLKQVNPVVAPFLSYLDTTLHLDLHTLILLTGETLSAITHPLADHRCVSLSRHTDIGVIKMLFTMLGGLRILPSGFAKT